MWTQFVLDEVIPFYDLDGDIILVEELTKKWGARTIAAFLRIDGQLEEHPDFQRSLLRTQQQGDDLAACVDRNKIFFRTHPSLFTPARADVGDLYLPLTNTGVQVYSMGLPQQVLDNLYRQGIYVTTFEHES